VKMTLLEMTQSILSSLDGDEVNSISDTVEAAQIATIVKNSYFDIVSSLNLPEHHQLFELTATNSSTPVVMYRPSDVTDVHWVKYNNATTQFPDNDFVDVEYLPFEEFINRSYRLQTSTDNVESCSITTRDADSLTVNYLNDVFPRFYTTWDESIILFDAYKASEDSFLQKSKVQCYGEIVPSWTHSNTFTPNLDAKHFTLLLNEAKAQAFIELKQQANPKAEKRARRGWIQAQRTKKSIGPDSRYTAYGRK
jgi:hypothetical protein